ncbi:hypothetical protein CPC16_001448 [Podila verticillata]|nr:hypothetical protein BGZ52_002035 [Haplosporangium bisporale]KAF9212958.1 hypothetical protein BGZ59_006103 [Podila verticillata]KAF9393664.1 hypothetical protein CPC16_001448 [Podila verticillata]KAI9236487.1 MAG: hypothetical protein BYD32DRAFT_418585 [Podila humilis]KFH65521.1 hypothetical protein MVEG_08998 [Podila verticillata NRRL 6337]
MSFIFNLFSDNSTPAERENAAQLKVLIDERKTVLKAELQPLSAACAEKVKAAKAEYKRIKQQAKDELQQQIQSAVNREMDAITASEAFVGSDERTKGKVESVRSWLTSSASEKGHCGREGNDGGHCHGKRQDGDEKNRALNQDGEGVLPDYSSAVDTKEQ